MVTTLEVLRAWEYVNKRYPKADLNHKRNMLIKALEVFNKEGGMI